MVGRGRSSDLPLFLCLTYCYVSITPGCGPGLEKDRTDKQATWSFGRRFAKLLACQGKRGLPVRRKNRQASNGPWAAGLIRQKRQASYPINCSFVLPLTRVTNCFWTKGQLIGSKANRPGTFRPWSANCLTCSAP